jgi:hypothetical protein
MVNKIAKVKNINRAILYVRHGSKTPLFATPDIYF